MAMRFWNSISRTSTQRQIFELSVTMGVLAEMLQEAGLLDADALQSRTAAALEKAQQHTAPLPEPWVPKPSSAAPVTAQTGDPYRSAPIAEPTASCGRCGRVVAERLTVITEKGVICDLCAARGARR